MIGAVFSYHLNPLTCGVAKFNRQLAKRLGVPMAALESEWPSPLVSVKASELTLRDTDHLCQWAIQHRQGFDVLWHDKGLPVVSAQARRVFYASEIGCPSTLEGNPMRGVVNVLLFGMAHKVVQHPDYVERLRDLLRRATPNYTVSVSTAVHEGHAWDKSFKQTIDMLWAIFGDRHLRVLGYLADDALAKELADCSAAALFFDPAVRANNTSIWAALDAGCAVVTNLDEHSPAELVHNQTVFDIKRMTDWPFLFLRNQIAKAGHEAASGRTWQKLIEVLHA
jgi:hypothetical protein